ncbi:hypothetical protein tpqmel_0488 [Candidatus Gastranaerophilus sp. (ex Termes propinquus)]|nr:hypothetical protein tpqmel_0488 [Candidatus Gastranaerophilus sp. (ex Termes propinquus)]
MIQPQYLQQPQPAVNSGGGANAVAINIHNPQAFGAPQQQAAQSPVQYPIYGYPQSQVYSPQPMMQNFQQPYLPQLPMYQPPAPPAQAYPVAQEPIMPEPVLVPQMMPEVPVQPVAAPEQIAAPEPAAQTMPQASSVDVQGLIQGLNSPDPNAQADAITLIAQHSQKQEGETDEQHMARALQLVDTNLMGTLTNIIQQDTTSLEGPSKEQVAAMDKLQKGKNLTQQEQQLLDQVSPRELAEQNKIISMFTLAMLQGHQRDEVDNYRATAGADAIPAMGLSDLTGYNEIVNVVNTTQIPGVKVAAIQALGYAARPEDAQVLQSALANVANDTDPTVQAAYQDAMAKIGTVQA